jgi:DNA-damage-inducible protein J
MNKTATITTRVSPEIKESADALFSGLGLNTSEAISIFIHKALSYRGLPFDVCEDNYQHMSPLPETEYSKPIDNLGDLWAELEI